MYSVENATVCLQSYLSTFNIQYMLGKGNVAHALSRKVIVPTAFNYLITNFEYTELWIFHIVTENEKA